MVPNEICRLYFGPTAEGQSQVLKGFDGHFIGELEEQIERVVNQLGWK
jgi:hypothetical protein